MTIGQTSSTSLQTMENHNDVPDRQACDPHVQIQSNGENRSLAENK